MSSYSLFVKEFFRNFHSTGAILPSGPWLASALVRYVKEPGTARRILEVGPGTGAVTQKLVTMLRPDDRLDLVELNDRFVEQLRRRFETEPAFKVVADRATIHHCPVEELAADEKFDLIISGLPLNNFSAELVDQILGTLTCLLKPGGTLSFFEYIAVRAARTLISGGQERQRLQGISRAMAKVLDGHEIRRDWVWPNVPPAWVHHVRM